ncbi:MAG TPA: hypothetical protein VMJ31_09875, partial [Methylocystis sp.]|nr:hypothetical protein [Methylocystis sp.]
MMSDNPYNGNVAGELGGILTLSGQGLLIIYPNAKVLPYQLFNSFGNPYQAPEVSGPFVNTLATNRLTYDTPGPARLLSPGETGYVANPSNLYGNSGTVTAAEALKAEYGIALQNVELDLTGLPGINPHQGAYALPNGQQFTPDIKGNLYSLSQGRTVILQEAKTAGYVTNTALNQAEAAGYRLLGNTINTASAPFRYAGQALRGAGAVGLVYDTASTGVTIYQQWNTPGAWVAGFQYAGRTAGGFGGAAAGGLIGLAAGGPPGAAIGVFVGGLGGGAALQQIAGAIYNKALGPQARNAPPQSAFVPKPPPEGMSSIGYGAGGGASSGNVGAGSSGDGAPAAPVDAPMGWIPLSPVTTSPTPSTDGSTAMPTLNTYDPSQVPDGYSVIQYKNYYFAVPPGASLPSGAQSDAQDPVSHNYTFLINVVSDSGPSNVGNWAPVPGDSQTPPDQSGAFNSPADGVGGFLQAASNAVSGALGAGAGGADVNAGLSTPAGVSAPSGVDAGAAPSGDGGINVGELVALESFASGGDIGGGDIGSILSDLGSLLDGPVVLDLAGSGIKITPLASSNMFLDTANNG